MKQNTTFDRSARFGAKKSRIAPRRRLTMESNQQDGLSNTSSLEIKKNPLLISNTTGARWMQGQPVDSVIEEKGRLTSD